MIQNTHFDLPCGAVRLDGILDKKIKAVTDGTLKRLNMRALADYFRNTADMFATGEFWGKIMRGACLICRYSGEEELRRIIDRSVEDMLSIQKADGCISTVPVEKQPNGTNGSDMWERKYALIGLLAYYELSGRKDVLDAAARLVRYTNSQVGEPPKTPITDTGWCFFGIESSSILEPVMRVYRLTGDKAALELGAHIVKSGCCARENIFEAVRSGKSPKDIGSNGNPYESIAKAYEMMSCFEGLAEYYSVTGEKEAFETVCAFWNKLVGEEITLLGSGGADFPYNLGAGKGEQWNFTKFEQTNPDIELMMETCVTVYYMRLSHKLFMLTGEVVYADAIEVSLYNAIFGALKNDGSFFEYFPKFNGKRNPKVNYSFNIDGFDLSCCTANGPTALGTAPYIAVTRTKDGGSVNLYESGAYTVPTDDGFVKLTMKSEYPRFGRATVRIDEFCGTKNCALQLRVPAFAKNFKAEKGDTVLNGAAGSYLKITDTLAVGDEWKISFEIPLVRHTAPHGSNRAGDGFVAFTYGSILLARDSRTGENPLSIIPNTEPTKYEILPSCFGGWLEMKLYFGEAYITLTDYMSAGNDWQDTEFASWLPIK